MLKNYFSKIFLIFQIFKIFFVNFFVKKFFVKFYSKKFFVKNSGWEGTLPLDSPWVRDWKMKNPKPPSFSFFET